MGFTDFLSAAAINARKQELLKKFEDANAITETKKPAVDRNTEYEIRTLNETAVALDDMKATRIAESKQYADSVARTRTILLTEAFMVLYNKSRDSMDENYDENLARGYISNFIKDEDPRLLLTKMKHSSMILSELAKCVEGASCDDCSEKEEIAREKKLKIDPTTKDKFFEDLNNVIDMEDVGDTIKLRVSDAMADFITSNTAKKAKIEDAIEQVKDKVNSDTTEEVKEAYKMAANRRIDRINKTSRVNMFEKLVQNLSESAYRNQDIRHHFCENGQLNFDKVITHVKTMYTVLEMFNTLGLKNFTADYVSGILESYAV